MIASCVEEVIRSPDDDYMRLVAADVIARDDPARGEFIRAQVANERLLAAATTEVDVQRILGAEPPPDADWADELAETQVSQRGFARGFIEHVQVPAGVFFERATELFERAPIRFVTLTGIEHELERLATSPHLARIRALRLPGYMPRPARYIGQPVFGELERDVNTVDTAVLEALCDSPHVAGLELLDLTGHAPLMLAAWARLDATASRLRYVIGAPRRGRYEVRESGYELSRHYQPDTLATRIDDACGRHVPWLETGIRLSWWQRLRAVCAHAQLVEEAG